MSMCAAVDQALEKADLTDADVAAVRLARLYADAIDDAEDYAEGLKVFGPKLLAALDALRLTPKARALAGLAGPAADTGKGGEPSATGSPLDQLRAKRAARLDRAAPVDTAAP